MRPAKNRSNRSEPPGIAFEKLVAKIQQMMDPNSTVTHNEKLLDRVGNTRQCDVVVRGQFGGRPIVGLVECKDNKRRKGPGDVEAFAKKTEHLGANLRIMVSRNGFTKQALRLAVHEGIGCLSLLPKDSEQVGFSIGDMWYGVIRKWTDISLTIQFALPMAPIPTFNAASVRLKGKPVANWFLKELFTTYGDETKPGPFTIALHFDAIRNLEVDGKEWPVSGISCTAFRVFRKKRKWVSWSGDALYDWHTHKISIPANGTVVGSAVETDLDAWPDFDGDIPNVGEPIPDGFVRAVLVSAQKWDPTMDVDVPDLENL